jgi:hypothetical protein
MLSVQKAEYVGAYKINLLFNNGKTGTANLEKTIFNDKRAIFLSLRNESSFKEFKVEHSTVVWSSELDLAPEYLFYLAFMEQIEFQEQFKQWGYIN